MSYKDSNREHNRSLSRDTSPLKDQYADIYRDQSKYAEILKRQERERSEKNRREREEADYKQKLVSLQTKLDITTPPAPKTFTYVAYGSNLSVEQMALRCPDATIIGTGKIWDYKLVFRFHADIEKSKGSYVPVLVWKISKADEKRLDIYEGVAGGYYHQEEVKVLMDKTPLNQVLMNQDDNNDGEGSENGNKDGKGNHGTNKRNFREVTKIAYWKCR